MPSAEQRRAADAIRADRAFWRELVDEVGRAHMNEPGPMGEWTFKDLTAHLAAWRNYRIGGVEAIARDEPVPPAPWPAGLEDDDYDAINAWFNDRDRGRSLDDILGDYDGSFERMAAAIEALPDAVAHDPNGLPWAGGTAAIDIDFTEHLHEEHAPAIRKWLATRA